MKQVYYLISFVVLTLIGSCDRDPLYYATADTATMRFNVDWSGADLSPNGVTAFIYKNTTGDVLRLRETSSNPNCIDLELPVGTYDIIFVNDTEAELDNVNYGGTFVQSTFKAYATTGSESKFKTGFGQRQGLFTGESDLLAKGVVRNVIVTPSEIEYHKTRPSDYQPVIVKEFQVVPERVSEVLHIEVEVLNIGSAAAAPLSNLTNMALGCFMDNDQRLDDNVTIEFSLNKRTLDKTNTNVGVISREFFTFGLHDHITKANRPHTLLMHFQLTNGETYQVALDVTDSINTEHSDINTVHTIRGKVELPVVIGNGGGPFNPELEEWEDTIVELPV